MAWPNSDDAISNLRDIIFDGPEHKYCSMKKVLGVVDGENTVFKTFENRRITDFSDEDTTMPYGVFINGEQVAASGVTSDDLVTGTFTLDDSILPSNRDAVTATYFYHWYVDSELSNFLRNASTWLGFSNEYHKIPNGLNASALRFAAKEAYLMAAMRYSIRYSEIYKLEDAPDETILKSIDAFRSMADDFMKDAEKMRDDFYTRQGQSLAPNFAFGLGKVVDPVPRR